MFKLISIDLDGTLALSNSFDYVIHRIGGDIEKKFLEIEEAFATGEISYEKMLVDEFSLLIGLRASIIRELASEIPLIPGAKSAIAKFREAGLLTVLLTDNPDVVIDVISKRLGIDYALGTKMKIKNDIIVSIEHVNSNKKEKLRELINELGISFEECIHIGDWINDIELMKAVGFSIAINPRNPEVIRAAKITIRTKNFMDVYNVLKDYIFKN
ncbi:MAG: HAD family hydrolase [Candidatus Njordarchaeia archaeon]|nr:HAD family phosphatase [Candidatus Korarchaeota archaeon]